jgi:L-ascorbate 6-phosphate lactonase
MPPPGDGIIPAMSFGRTLATARPVPGGLIVFALGQSGYALRGERALVLIDPWLSTALEDEEGVTRPAPPPLRPHEVEAADVVCITHEHADHLDPQTVAAIAERVPAARFVVPAPIAGLVDVPGERVVAVRAGETVAAGDVEVTAVAAAHELHPDAFGGYRFWRDEQGDHRCLSYLFALEGHRVFHAGDTIWWPGLEDELRALAPDLAMLPINGRDAMREAQGLWGNLSADEAAALAVAAGLGAVLACHFDGVAGNLGDPEAFVTALARRDPAIRAHVLHPGEELHLQE